MHFLVLDILFDVSGLDFFITKVSILNSMVDIHAELLQLADVALIFLASSFTGDATIVAVEEVEGLLAWPTQLLQTSSLRQIIRGSRLLSLSCNCALRHSS